MKASDIIRFLRANPAFFDDNSALLTELTLIRQRYRLNAPELKWQQLARRANGSAVFRAIFEVMLANAAIPFFHVMDKDYILAAKAVEAIDGTVLLEPVSGAAGYPPTTMAVKGGT